MLRDTGIEVNCEAAPRGAGGHTGYATHGIRVPGDRPDQYTAVCGGHLSSILEGISNQGSEAIANTEHWPLTADNKARHKSVRSDQQSALRGSLEDPLQSYWGKDVAEGYWGREKPRDLDALREQSAASRRGSTAVGGSVRDLSEGKSTLENTLEDAAQNGGRNVAGRDMKGRPNYIRNPKTGEVSRVYRFELHHPTGPEGAVARMNPIQQAQAQGYVGSPTSAGPKKKVVEDPKLGEGTGLIDAVIRTYKAGGDYKKHALSVGISVPHIEDTIKNLRTGEKPKKPGTFAKGGGRSGRATAVVLQPDEDTPQTALEKAYERRSQY
jgi:hypothetical protein